MECYNFNSKQIFSDLFENWQMEAQTARKLLFRSILLVLLISFIHSEKLVDPLNVKNTYENPNILLNGDNEVDLEQTTEGNQNMIYEGSNIAMAKPEEIT